MATAKPSDVVISMKKVNVTTRCITASETMPLDIWEKYNTTSRDVTPATYTALACAHMLILEPICLLEMHPTELEPSIDGRYQLKIGKASCVRDDSPNEVLT